MVKLISSFVIGFSLCLSPLYGEEATPTPPDTKAVSTKKKKKERPNIAVSDFGVTNVAPQVAVIVCNAISDALVNTRRFNVIERSRMEEILKEQAFQKSGCTTQECAVEIGKLLNVRFMVIGTVELLEEMAGSGRGEYTVTVRVVDVQTANTIASKAVTVQSQTALRKAAQEAVLYLAPIIGGDPGADVGGDSSGFLQDLVTIIGVVGAFAAAAFSGQ